jgi:hypothetical protein
MHRPTPRPRPIPGPTQPATGPSGDPNAERPAGEGAARSAGALIASRYRLLERAGEDTSVHAEFWRARDTVLQRDVGLTLLRHTGEPGETARAADMVGRALRWGRFEHPGCARLLDVLRRDNSWDSGGLPEDVLALAVTEWVPGRSLAEAAASGPLRTASVLGMVDPLAQAAEAAHRQGLVLGCAHPRRVRITPEGRARLAFALPRPQLTPADDVQGLGALLYTLLTGHWPLSGTDAELAGLPPAPRDLRGVVVPPTMVRPGLIVEVSALAMGALGVAAPHGQVHTAAGVQKVLAELLATEQEAALLPPPDDGAAQDPDEVWRIEDAEPDTAERRRKVGIGMAGLGIGVVGVLTYVSIQVGSALGLTSSESGPPITLTTPAPPAAAAPSVPGAAVPGAASPAVPGVAAPGAPVPGTAAQGDQDAPVTADRQAEVHPTAVQVFDPTGDPDNTGRVARVMDDDPSSTWNTYIYRRQFPALKNGVGIMVSFASPVQLATLTIGSQSAGTQLQIRSAPSPDASFAQTIPIGQTTIASDSTTVSLAGSQPVQNVLVWITKLGGGGDQNVTEISELHFERVTG